MRVTVRLDDDRAEHVEAIREADDSDAEAIRTAIDRSQRLADAEADDLVVVATEPDMQPFKTDIDRFGSGFLSGTEALDKLRND